MKSIVVICMPQDGHLQRLLPLIQNLRAHDRPVHVMAHAGARLAIERTGANFYDLFGRYPIEAVDATSVPLPSRYVSFAAAYATRLAHDVAELEPSLIVYDTFAVVAPLVARILGLPYVNVCAGHAALPGRFIAELQAAPWTFISPQCHAAVEQLKRDHAVADANPFMFAQGQSPYLNVYCEPEEFLLPEDRPAFEPIAFFGSLAPALRDAEPASALFLERPLRIYASFGTVVWRYYPEVAYEALGVLASTLAGLDASVVISLGGHDLEAAQRGALRRRNLRIESYVAQWSVLKTADLFITHQGLNSTHEAIYHQVPMLSYPFFGDQPALARRCQDLGLAVALAAGPRAPIEAASLRSAIEQILAQRQRFKDRLTEAALGSCGRLPAATK